MMIMKMSVTEPMVAPMAVLARMLRPGLCSEPDEFDAVVDDGLCTRVVMATERVVVDWNENE